MMRFIREREKRDYFLLFIFWTSVITLFFFYYGQFYNQPPNTDNLSQNFEQSTEEISLQNLPSEFGWFERVNVLYSFSNVTDDEIFYRLQGKLGDKLESLIVNEQGDEETHVSKNLWGISFGRFDNDVYLDMFAVDLDSGRPLILWNNRNGNFIQLENAFFPTFPFYLSDSLNIVSSLWGDYNNDQFDDLVISTSIGIFIFRNSERLDVLSALEEDISFRVLFMFQYIPLEDGVCAGELSWIANEERKLDLVVWCIDENSQPSYPVLLWKFDPELQNFTQLSTSPIISPQTLNYQTHFVMIETSSFVTRKTWNSVTYEHNLILVGNQVPLNEIEQLQLIDQNDKTILEISLSYTFRHVHILHCPLYSQLWNVTELSSLCVKPTIQWDQVTFLSKEELWTDFTFQTKSSTLGDVNSDSRVDMLIYGGLFDKDDIFVASVLLILLNQDRTTSVPLILVVREYSQGHVIDSNLEEKVLNGCDCQSSDCLINLSVVLGDFDNDMDLDVIVLDSIRGEKECTIMSLLLNDGNANLVSFSNLVFPPLSQRTRGELIPETTRYRVGNWPISRPSLIVVDYDNDGALDLFFSLEGHLISFHNDLYPLDIGASEHTNWIEVDLVPFSKTEVPHNVGKILKLQTNTGVDQIREIYGGLKGSSRVHFGLGSNVFVKRIVPFEFMIRNHLFGYRDLKGNQVLYLVDIKAIRFITPAMTAMFTINPIKNLDECPEPNKTRLEPEFMIIGFWKCGTTGLHEFLIQHPQILPSSVKELKFFSLPEASFSTDSLQIYKAQFPCGFKNYHHTFDATPSYAIFPFVPVRINATFPSLKKFIMCVRNPVDRAYSYFQMMTRNYLLDLNSIYLLHECILANRERYTAIDMTENICLNDTSFMQKFSSVSKQQQFDTIIRVQLWIFRFCFYKFKELIDEDTIYKCPRLLSMFLPPSLYYYHLSYWYKFYPKESFLIIHYADLLDHQSFSPTMAKIVNFLSLEEHSWQPPPPNVVSKYSSMWRSTRKLLTEFFEEHNEKFYKLVGVDYGW